MQPPPLAGEALFQPKPPLKPAGRPADPATRADGTPGAGHGDSAGFRLLDDLLPSGKGASQGRLAGDGAASPDPERRDGAAPDGAAPDSAVLAALLGGASPSAILAAVPPGDGDQAPASATAGSGKAGAASASVGTLAGNAARDRVTAFPPSDAATAAQAGMAVANTHPAAGPGGALSAARLAATVDAPAPALATRGMPGPGTVGPRVGSPEEAATNVLRAAAGDASLSGTAPDAAGMRTSALPPRTGTGGPMQGADNLVAPLIFLSAQGSVKPSLGESGAAAEPPPQAVPVETAVKAGFHPASVAPASTPDGGSGLSPIGPISDSTPAAPVPGLTFAAAMNSTAPPPGPPATPPTIAVAQTEVAPLRADAAASTRTQPRAAEARSGTGDATPPAAPDPVRPASGRAFPVDGAATDPRSDPGASLPGDRLPLANAAATPAPSSGVERTATAALPTPLAPAHPPLPHQLAEALRGQTAGSYEISLRPEELGRVRMALHPADAGVAVQISAERPETLDLIRRHLPELDRDLRQLGHASVSFSFAGEGGGRQPQAQAQARPAPSLPDGASPTAATAPLPEPVATRRRGLDIRL